MFKDLFSIKSPVGVVLTLLVALAIFFLGQSVAVFMIALVLTAIGKSQAEIESTFAANSYWPKAIAFTIVSAFVIWFVFRALSLWRLASSRGKSKKTEKKSKK